MTRSRQNWLLPEHIEKIVSTYQFRIEEDRYSRRVTMEEIANNDYNLNISRYISTEQAEEEVDLQAVNIELVTLAQNIEKQGINARRYQVLQYDKLL